MGEKADKGGIFLEGRYREGEKERNKASPKLIIRLSNLLGSSTCYIGDTGHQDKWSPYMMRSYRNDNQERN